MGKEGLLTPHVEPLGVGQEIQSSNGFGLIFKEHVEKELLEISLEEMLNSRIDKLSWLSVHLKQYEKLNKPLGDWDKEQLEFLSLFVNELTLVRESWYEGFEADGLTQEQGLKQEEERLNNLEIYSLEDAKRERKRCDFYDLLEQKWTDYNPRSTFLAEPPSTS